MEQVTDTRFEHTEHRTVFDGKNSSWGSIYTDVPQGSVLGPILYLVYESYRLKPDWWEPNKKGQYYVYGKRDIQG